MHFSADLTMDSNFIISPARSLLALASYCDTPAPFSSLQRICIFTMFLLRNQSIIQSRRNRTLSTYGPFCFFFFVQKICASSITLFVITLKTIPSCRSLESTYVLCKQVFGMTLKGFTCTDTLVRHSNLQGRIQQTNKATRICI